MANQDIVTVGAVDTPANPSLSPHGLGRLDGVAIRCLAEQCDDRETLRSLAEINTTFRHALLPVLYRRLLARETRRETRRPLKLHKKVKDALNEAGHLMSFVR